MNQTVISILTLIVGLVAALAAWAAYVRAGRWRDSEQGRAVTVDIHAIKNELTKINSRLAIAEKVDAGLPILSERVATIETRLESVASSGDFRALKAEVDGLGRDVKNTLAGVSRIEGWLVEGRGQ